MAFDTFAPATPQLGTRPEEDEVVREFKAGERCKKSFPDGLNAQFESVDLQWNGLTSPEMTYIRTFWKGHGRANPFWYQLPDDDAPRLWRFASPLSRNPLGGGQYSSGIKIEEAVDLG